MVAASINMRDETEKLIDLLKELMETSETDMSEAYKYFFMTILAIYKEDLTKVLEGDVPYDIEEVYRRVQNISIAKKWTENTQDKRYGEEKGKEFQ